jgi:cytochrome c-type biogenesis protein CcmE
MTPAQGPQVRDGSSATNARTPRKRGTLAAMVAIVLGAFAYLLYGGLGSNLVYFLTPTELLAKGTEAVNVPVRLGGQVVPGSVVWDAARLDLRFHMKDVGKEVTVHSKGAPPQMFRPGMGVVVEGRFSPEGVFEATSLMVKHSNEYRAPEPGHTPSEMYKSLVTPTGAPK